MTYNYNNSILETFTEEIKTRISGKKYMTTILSAVLNVTPKTIRKKIKGEAPFTFDEIITLCNEYDMDLNAIIKRPSSSHLLKLYISTGSEQPGSGRYTSLDIYRIGAGKNNIEIFIAGNSYPESVLCKYKYLAKMHRMLYQYYNIPDFTMAPGDFKNIVAENEYYTQYTEIFSSYQAYNCIISIHMMSNLTELISYFYNLNKLDTEDIRNIREDCEYLLDWLENLCDKETFENGNPVTILVSQINLPTDFCLLKGDDFQWAGIRLQYNHPIWLDDPEIINRINGWFDIYKKTSINITGTADLHKNYVFNKQRADLKEKLSELII